MLEKFIESVLREGASDLHLAEGRVPILRVAGELIPLTGEAELSREGLQTIIDQLMTEDNKKLFQQEQQVDFSYNYQEKTRFRCNLYIRQGKYSLAMRNIPNEIRTLEELSLPNTLEYFAQKKQGFFLVVGPTGNGKTTTIAAILDIINQNRLEHIITIEDPIEYVITPKKSIIDQREVRTDTPDFATALKGVFRQDVDVALIGEMRTPETMATAVTAAETGHLIFSTLHTNNAAQSIERIVDSFPAAQQEQIRLQLSGSLAGIFSIRLIPRVSGGLVPAYELMIANNAIRNLIREQRTHEIDTVIETSSDEGMIDLNRSLASLVKAGEITVENAYINSVNQKTLEKML